MTNTSNAQGILTTQGRTALSAFVAPLIVGNSALVKSSLYGFIGRTEQWPIVGGVEQIPTPTEDQFTIKNTFKNIVGLKDLTIQTASPVVPRIDWVSGDVYSAYVDTISTFQFDANGIQVNPFYVRNSYDQIFKCLSNNNGSPSLVEPSIVPGTTLPTTTLGVVPQTPILYLPDGYKWAYITTIDKGLKKTFFDSQWMPIPFSGNIPNTLVPAGIGQVDVINVTNGGSSYSPGLTSTVVAISGDGYGATAAANVDITGVVTDVIVTNPGTGYTYATATISPTQGNSGFGATANVTISPIGGTAYDPVSELGCNHVMFTFEFDGDEAAQLKDDTGATNQPPLPVNVSFRQIGIIANAILTNGNFGYGSVYNPCDAISTTSGVGTYQTNPSEYVYQGTNWSGYVTAHDTQNNIVQVINTTGQIIIGQPIIGSISGTQRVVIQYTPTPFDVGSGYMMYYENRSPTTRLPNGNEQLRLVLKF